MIGMAGVMDRRRRVARLRWQAVVGMTGVVDRLRRVAAGWLTAGKSLIGVRARRTITAFHVREVFLRRVFNPDQLACHRASSFVFSAASL
jgi:hypothetical protein